MLLYSVTVTLLTAVAILAHGPPGVPPRQNAPPQQQQQFQQNQQQQQQFQQQQQPNAQGHGHDGGNLKFASEIHNADHIMEHLQNVIKTKPKDQMTEEELEFHYFKMHDYDNNNKLDGVEIGKALTHFHDDHDDKQDSNATPPTPAPHATPPPPGGTNPGEGTATGGSVDGADAVGPDGGSAAQPTRGPIYTDEAIASLIDTVLTMYDKNDDGYVEYFEYRKFKQGAVKEPEQQAHDHDDKQDSNATPPTTAPNVTPSPTGGANPGESTATGGSVDGTGAVGPDDGNTAQTHNSGPIYADELISSLVNKVLGMFDKNEDGYVEYAEYKKFKQEAVKEPERKAYG